MRSLTSLFFNDTATTEIYTLSLHDALPISVTEDRGVECCGIIVTIRDNTSQVLTHQIGMFLDSLTDGTEDDTFPGKLLLRSEEHTSELQSRQYLVCRLLLEKKKIKSSPSKN